MTNVLMKEDIELAMRWRAEGVKVEAIARRLGVHKGTISRLLRGRTYDGRGRCSGGDGRRKLSDEDRARAFRLRREGWTLDQIGREVGVSFGHVSRLLKDQIEVTTYENP